MKQMPMVGQRVWVVVREGVLRYVPAIVKRESSTGRVFVEVSSRAGGGYERVIQRVSLHDLKGRARKIPEVDGVEP